jgi:hypothetical protein
MNVPLVLFVGTTAALAVLAVSCWRLRAQARVLRRRLEQSAQDLQHLQMAFSRFAPDEVIERVIAATLTVTRQVVDAKGKTIPASMSVEEVRLTLGPAHPGIATRLEHEVTVVGAERRYPDDPGSHWALDGVKVKVVTFSDGDGSTLEVRFDTPEGRGSFWETLRRAGGNTNRRSTR